MLEEFHQCYVRISTTISSLSIWIVFHIPDVVRCHLYVLTKIPQDVTSVINEFAKFTLKLMSMRYWVTAIPRCHICHAWKKGQSTVLQKECLPSVTECCALKQRQGEIKGNYSGTKKVTQLVSLTHQNKRKYIVTWNGSIHSTCCSINYAWEMYI